VERGRDRTGDWCRQFAIVDVEAAESLAVVAHGALPVLVVEVVP
jgi:hypothetical protein